MPTAAVSVSASGESTVIEAVEGKRICVLGLFLTADAAAWVTIQDTDDEVMSHLRVGDGGGAAWFFRDSTLTTGDGAGLVLDLDETANVRGHVEYTLQ